MEGQLKKTLKITTYALLPFLLAACNILIYIQSFFSQTDATMTEPNQVDSLYFAEQFTFPALFGLALLTTIGIYLINNKPFKVKPAVLFSLLTLLIAAANFGVYFYSFIEQTNFYISAEELKQSISMMLQTTLPAFFAVTGLVCLASFWLGKPK